MVKCTICPPFALKGMLLQAHGNSTRLPFFIILHRESWNMHRKGSLASAIPSQTTHKLNGLKDMHVTNFMYEIFPSPCLFMKEAIYRRAHQPQILRMISTIRNLWTTLIGKYPFKMPLRNSGTICNIRRPIF